MNFLKSLVSEVIGAPKQPTSCQLFLDRKVFQAGSVLSGRVDIYIGESDVEAFKLFNLGAMIELNLIGSEKTWWATNHKHDLQRVQTYRNQVNGQERREKANLLINEQKQIQI
jgi:hypothetical protein